MNAWDAGRLALANWWAQRAQRERRLLRVAAVLVIVWLGFNVLIGPALRGSAQIAAQLPGMQRQLAGMEAQAQEAASLANAAQTVAPAGAALTVALTASLADQGLAASGLDAAVNGAGAAGDADMRFGAGGGTASVTGSRAGVRLRFAQVPFARLVVWLNRVRTQLKVTVIQAHITPIRAPDGVLDGRVDAEVTLGAPDASLTGAAAR